MADNRRYTKNPRKYYKSNFVDFIEKVTPELYRVEDLQLSGKTLNPISDVINRHVSLANEAETYFSISAIDGDPETENINNVSGLSQFFVKQNKLTRINPYDLETKILLPLSSTLANYATSAEFYEYLRDDLLPKLIPPTNTTAGTIEDNISELSAFTQNAAASSVHNYLVDALGWFYFLNTSALGGLDYSPSSYVLDSFVRVYEGDTLETVDGVKGLTEYLWRNTEACSFGQFIPPSFLSGPADAILSPSAGEVATYTSGTQKLDAFKTLIDVIYSPLYIDEQDYTVKEAFDDFISAQTSLADLVSKGPHRKLTSLLGFNYADISDQIENIGLIYDIESCPEEYLENIAQLIGFRLRGGSPDKWRQQLRIAVDLYKKSGTLGAIQTAINALITNSVFDVSGKALPLWESYVPNLIWYALGTESPLFRDLSTWTAERSHLGGVFSYDSSSLEENIKMVTDSILLTLYKAFPENFVFFGERFQSPRFWVLDNEGCEEKLYTVVGEPGMLPFHVHEETSPGYQALRRDAILKGEIKAFEAAYANGPLGEGVYMAGLTHPQGATRPTYLKFEGDLNFLFNYRGKINYPLPPFEEVKYYKDCTVTQPMVELLVDRLKCFKVDPDFADYLGQYISDAAVSTDSNLGSINEWLMFFSGVQTPQNFDDVMTSISDYERNLLPLFNGKSSHIFIDFDDTDFDFAKNTFEGDGKYALYEAARTTREFSPAHAITRVNLNASAEDSFTNSDSRLSYLAFDKDDSREKYSSNSIISNFENSGVDISFATGGGDDGRGSDGGRGGLNTFKRASVSSITGPYLSGTSVVDVATVPRRALRRRNYKYLLPKEAYYDRTGFNSPTSFDASVLENSLSSLGELTLGYVASAGKFFPVVDPINPSGVWDICEGYNSTRSFSGVDSSNTFPYRGLYDVTSREDRYVDRGQVPRIYVTMHELYEQKARDFAKQEIEAASALFVNDDYWKDNIQSYANSAIASGLVLNSISDYENFTFGVGPHKLFADHKKYFEQPISVNLMSKTGPNVISHVFASGLYNCDFSIDGSLGSDMVASSLRDSSAINVSSLWKTGATGTVVATDQDDTVIPLTGTYTAGAPFNAEFRNAEVLSGIEFCDISGSPSSNEFRVFRVDQSFAVAGKENYLVANPVIKCKSSGGGLPRIRFDLSSYGPQRNYFIKDHKFRLDVRALVAQENSNILGGGSLAAWIHTQPKNGYFWTWTPDGKWTPMKTDSLSISKVINISHKYDFPAASPPKDTAEFCLNNIIDTSSAINNVTLNNIRESYFKDFSVEFDTRNFTKNNNYEYLDIIPIPEEFYKNQEQVHSDDTNYIVEVFFVPNSDSQKYLLIDLVRLQDLTERDRAGIGTGHGEETKNIPFTPFVKEDKLEFDKRQLIDVLKFYNSLTGEQEPQYTTSFASRDATITSGIMELSGGSRLTYRVHPDWVPNTKSGSQYTEVEFDN